MLCFSVYSPSRAQEVYETSPNAAANGLDWVMSNILPQQAGLTVNGVVYRYTTVKETEDDMVVHVQNEDALNLGQYIFRSTDDWSGLPGNTIRKLVPVNNIPRERWGDGSIQIEGKGSVENALVLYNYQYDPCFGVTDKPECPNYIPPIVMPDLAMQDPLDDPYIKEELEKETEVKDEDEDERDRKRTQENGKVRERRSLESILGIVEVSLVAAADIANMTLLTNLNTIPNSYYVILPDTKYEETIVLPDATLPDNTRAARVNFAQDQLHQRMVNLQYEQ